jgi:hypothetical protein
MNDSTAWTDSRSFCGNAQPEGGELLAVRDGSDWSWPQIANSGPKAMLINGWSGSGGDCFPVLFPKE